MLSFVMPLFMRKVFLGVTSMYHLCIRTFPDPIHEEWQFLIDDRRRLLLANHSNKRALDWRMDTDQSFSDFAIDRDFK